MSIMDQLRNMDRRTLAILHVVALVLVQGLMYMQGRRLEKIPLFTTLLHLFILISTIIVHALHLNPRGVTFSINK